MYYGGRLTGYVINKAHHVDVGGPSFGSISPLARTIYEEGLIVPPVKLVEGGNVRRDVLRLIVANVKDPARAEGDLMAQVAANLVGAARVRELASRLGARGLLDGWRESIEYASRLTAKAMEGWPAGTYRAEDVLEVGPGDRDLVTLGVELRLGEEKFRASFTAPLQLDRPLNAVYGVTYAATAFVARALMGVDVPVNEGLYSRVEAEAPEGSMLNPRPPAPVAAGNLETSQRLVDVLLRAAAQALPDRVPAASAGTMMNIMLGGIDRATGRAWAYYETMGGGSGAGPWGPGTSAVHTNMTNTMNTPIEVAERSYPIMFTRYEVREGSGGKGMYRGGDGIIRAFRALAPMRLSVLGSRFRSRPWGLRGGGDGEPARLRVIRADGRVEELPPFVTVDLGLGDEVIIETPGGGGYGASGL